MSGYLLSPELRGFEKKFNVIVNTTYRDPLSVFDDFLTYCICALNPEPKPVQGWSYKKEHNVLFFDLMQEWIMVQAEQVKKKGWYDAFGEFFMACVGHTSRQYRGQFFTPPHICDFMAEITMGDTEEKEGTTYCGGFGNRTIVSDCACGSARLLLAAHAIACKENHKPRYYVAEDIDYMCCKMSALNLCIHGCFGEVVCHDTLTEPEQVRVGYVINECLYPFPACPSIRVFTDDRNFVATRIWKEKRIAEEQRAVVVEEPVHLPEPKCEDKVRQLEIEFVY